MTGLRGCRKSIFFLISALDLSVYGENLPKLQNLPAGEFG
jgi:hypothetical protein